MGLRPTGRRFGRRELRGSARVVQSANAKALTPPRAPQGRLTLRPRVRDACAMMRAGQEPANRRATMRQFLGTVQLVVAIALMALIGQGVLYILAGRGPREEPLLPDRPHRPVAVREAVPAAHAEGVRGPRDPVRDVLRYSRRSSCGSRSRSRRSRHERGGPAVTQRLQRWFWVRAGALVPGVFRQTDTAIKFYGYALAATPDDPQDACQHRLRADARRAQARRARDVRPRRRAQAGLGRGALRPWHSCCRS